MLDTVVAPKAWILLLMKLTRNQKLSQQKILQIGLKKTDFSLDCSTVVVLKSGSWKCVVYCPLKGVSDS